jgi:predicted transglutaminase-like cysteine proteinase
MSSGGLFAAIFRIAACGLLLLLVIGTAIPVFTGEPFVINERTLRRAESQYGPEARQRLLAWQKLLRAGGENDLAKLKKTNRFFNKMSFIDDAVHWKKTDYWATPAEFLASAGGDCEDFAIAKYFTLLQLGVAESRMTLTYVKALRLNQAHMVLTYYPAPGADPLVLDNLVDAIEPSSKRTDLLPIYSLNGSGLWVAKQRGRGKMVGNSSRLRRWQELLERMSEELHQDEDAP